MNRRTIKRILRSASIASQRNFFEILTRRLDEFQSTLDQLILREIEAAVDALGDAKESKNHETIVIRLRFAETRLLVNTRLDPEGNTGPYRNRYLIAFSHHALAHVCCLRGDEDLAVKHLMRMFDIEPRKSREEFEPETFNTIIRPGCSELYNWYKNELSLVETIDFEQESFNSRAQVVLCGTGALALSLLTRRPQLMLPTTRLLYKWKELSPEYLKKDAIAKIEEELNCKLDNECREFARSALQGFLMPIFS